MTSRGDKVLVTGAGGFIGSHLAELLVAEGFQVRAFVRYNSNSTWGWLEQSPRKGDMEVVTGDIRDSDSVRRAVTGCRTVFHLAALTSIPYSYVSPAAYFQTNAGGTLHVLQAALEGGIENVVIASTSEVYGTAQYVPIDERHPTVAQSPYAASKVAAEQLAVSYYHSFELPVKIVRAFNTYGPRQSARAVIPAVAVPILSGANRVELGNLHPTRSFTFVEDTVEAFLLVARCESLVGEITNIGSGDEISIEDLVGRISRMLGRCIRIDSSPQRIRPAGSEVHRLVCDHAKITTRTGWVADCSLEDGLSRTIEWLRSNLHRYKPDMHVV